MRGCQLDRDINKCMIDCLKAGMPHLQRKNGYFDLLGFDFMITAAPENRLVLIEINTNPSLAVGELDGLTGVHNIPVIFSVFVLCLH